MQNPFRDHLFTKMIEGKHEPALSSSAAETVLQRLEEVGERIRNSEGTETRDTVLKYKETKRALERIRDYCTNTDASITDEDHGIYYSFVADTLEKAEQVIDKEFDHLGL